MDQPVYLTLPAGPLRDACLQAFAADTLVGTSLDALGSGETTDPGVVLLGPEQLSVGELAALAERLYARGSGWRFALVHRGSPPEIQVLSVGHAEALEEVARAASDLEANRGALLELREILQEVSRARHDINNPLTSAMAEVQLLLMDVGEGEVREGLDVIQTQLRRIRDLVADTGHIRAPRSR